MTRPAVLLLVLALAGGAALRCTGFDAPFENGSRGINGSWYAGQAARHFDESGFGATRGVPRLGSFPGTLEASVLYVTHPAPLSWLFWAGSQVLPGEAGIRLVPLLAALLGLPLCWWMLRRHASPLAAAAGTLVFAALPMASFFGSIPSGESLLLPWLFVFWMLAERWLQGGRPHALVLAFLGGALLDWSFYWAVPALAVVVLLRGEFRARWRVLLALGATGTVAVVLITLHLAWVCGGFAEFRTQIAGVLGTGLHGPETVGDLLTSIARHVLAVHGWPSLFVLTGLLAGAALSARKVGVLRAPLIFFALVATLHSVVFARHAAIHEFWTMSASGLFACAAAMLVDSCSVPRTRILVVLLVLGAAGVLALRSRALDAETGTTEHRERVAAIPELGEANCIALVEPFWIQEVWYARAHVWPRMETDAQFHLMRDTYARIYADASRRPSIVIILERARAGEAAAGLRRAVNALGIAPVQRGAFDVYRIPGSG